MLKIFLENNTLYAEDADGRMPLNPGHSNYDITGEVGARVFTIYEIGSKSVKRKSAQPTDVQDGSGSPVGTETDIHTYLSDKINFKPTSGGSGVGFDYTATNYTDLTTVVAPVAVEGDLAIVYNSQGVWLINRKLKGVYMYQSGVWEYANQELQNILQTALQPGDNVSSLINDSGYITSSSLKPSFNVDLDSAESSVVRAFSGGRTTFTITHNLNTLDIKPEVFRLSDGRTVGWRIERTGVNIVEVSRNGNIANGLFRLVI